MSIAATLTAPAPGPSRERPDGGDWITLAEAARILELHPTTVQRAALAGSIRFRSIAGFRVRYSRHDVNRIAAAS